MVKKYIYVDEWYPVYSLESTPDCPSDKQIDLDEDFIEEYETALLKFSEVQNKLDLIYKNKQDA